MDDDPTMFGIESDEAVIDPALADDEDETTLPPVDEEEEEEAL